MSYNVNLTYFKPNGKFYSNGDYISEKEHLFEIFEEVAQIQKEKKLPGLYEGHSDFAVYIRVPDHPHNHPHLLPALSDDAVARAEAVEQLEKIVCTEGCDEGVVLLSNEGPCDWDLVRKISVYRHGYFSPLGDALITLYKTLSGNEKLLRQDQSTD